MSEDELKKQLGKTPFLLWKKLQFCRNKKGVTFVTRKTLAMDTLAGIQWQSLSDKQIKTGLSRLRLAGLVRNHHAVLSKNKEAYLMKRTIYGALVIDANRGDLVAVPTNAMLCLRELPQRGGKRKGAGRKPKHLADCNLAHENNQRGPDMGANQKGPDTLSITREESGRSLSKERTSTGVGVATPREFLIFERDEDETFNEFREDGNEQGSRISGEDSEKFRSDDRLFHTAIPRYPAFSVVKPAQVPDPPKIPALVSDVEKAQFLLDAHRSVMMAKAGKRDFRAGKKVVDPTTLKQPTTEKQKKALSKAKRRFTFFKNAVEMFETHDISPVGWLAWSLDFWLENENDGEPPRIEWFYSKTRIAKHRGFYRKNSVGYSGGRLIHGRQYKRLITRYLKMRSALLNSNAPIPDVVDRYFPGSKYEQMVDEAKEESGNMQAELRRKIDFCDYELDGRFIW